MVDKAVGELAEAAAKVAEEKSEQPTPAPAQPETAPSSHAAVAAAGAAVAEESLRLAQERERKTQEEVRQVVREELEKHLGPIRARLEQPANQEILEVLDECGRILRNYEKGPGVKVENPSVVSSLEAENGIGKDGKPELKVTRLEVKETPPPNPGVTPPQEGRKQGRLSRIFHGQYLSQK